MMTTNRPDIASVEKVLSDEYGHPYGLSFLADCGSPDSPTSRGADFLHSVRTSTAEAIAYALADLDDGESFDPSEFSDAAHEVADSAVPVYTHDVWATFADLAAWQEDPSEYGVDASDMEHAAQTCLYIIARRLSEGLAEGFAEYLNEHDDPDA